LASVIAKEILKGQKVVAVRCEEINVSGTFIRNKLKYMAFLRKRTNTNPLKGPIHFRAPSKILWRTVRGMLPHKTTRGQLALGRLKVFDGVPPPYDRTKKVVIPEALRALRLKPMRKYTILGELSSEIGWGYGKVVKNLEDKRRVKAAAWYARQKSLTKLRQQAVDNTQGSLKKEKSTLENAGYKVQ